MILGRLRLLVAFFLTASQAGFVFADGAFDPAAQLENAGQRGDFRGVDRVQDAGGGGIRGGQANGRQAPVNARGAIAAAEREVGRPLTNQEKATVNSAIADANTASGHQVSPQVAAGIASFLVQNPDVAGNQPARNQVVNAFVWGSQFISPKAGGGLNFSVKSEDGKAVVVPNEGATTRGMQIVVPGARATGPVNMTATAGNGLGFNMTRSDIRPGSGQFVSSMRMENASAPQNGAFNGVRNVEGHQDNGGAVQRAAPNVQGRGPVDITFAATGNGGVNANWQTAAPRSPGESMNPAPAAPRGEAPLPAGHGDAAPHGAAVNNLPAQVTLPSNPTALNQAGTAQIPNAPTIPAAVVNHVAAGVPPNAAIPDTAANPGALLVHTTNLPGGNVMTVQLPPNGANATRAFQGGESAPVQVQIRGSNGTATVWASANRESNNNPAGREMGSRNGTLSFVVPPNVGTVQSVATVSATQNFRLNVTPDQNHAAFEAMVRPH